MLTSEMKAPRTSETGRAPTAQFPIPAASVQGGSRGRATRGRPGAEGDQVQTEDLMSRASAGDSDAFRELTAPYRRELQVHCYRMLGSLQDAEAAMQLTRLAAWQRLGGFEE